MKEEKKDTNIGEELKQQPKKTTEEDIVQKLTKENNELQEKIKYLQAETINYRKRKDEELESRLKYSNQELILEILSVVDNFELALKHEDVSEEVKNYLTGFKMMYTKLKEILTNFGVEEVCRIGDIFDPSKEQVLVTEEVKDKKEDEVLDVLQKGYILKGRVIRPATVKINKKNEKGEMKNE